MVFLCYPKCTTCQKAKAWLEASDISYDLRDIKLENPTADELLTWWKTSGLPTMSEEEQIALLATDGMLVKRPLLVGDDFVLTGFRQAEWEEKLK